jgi:hypothetical protein
MLFALADCNSAFHDRPARQAFPALPRLSETDTAAPLF